MQHFALAIHEKVHNELNMSNIGAGHLQSVRWSLHNNVTEIRKLFFIKAQYICLFGSVKCF